MTCLTFVGWVDGNEVKNKLDNGGGGARYSVKLRFVYDIGDG